MIKPVRQELEIIKKRNLKNGYHSITLGPFKGTSKCKPGHFVHVKPLVSPVHFRRALSVAGVCSTDKTIELILKVLGRGTQAMSELRKGDYLDILGPLGNGFALPKKTEKVVMIAGGIGFPPPLYLATEMIRKGYNPSNIEFFYGGRSKPDIIEKNRIRELGIGFHPTTDDGSFGTKGLVTELAEKMIAENDPGKMKLYACGPEPMLKAVNSLGLKYSISGQLSLEAPMPCGVGICLGCVVKLAQGGHARVCTDGPVFEIGEIEF